MKKYYLYKIARPIITTFMNLFYRIEVINNNYIPTDENAILCGNHTSKLDALLLMSSTKRTIRFLAKKELHKGLFKNIFLSAGTIPVDRTKKDENAKKEAINALNNKEIICIFPEGTINRSKSTILPFKYGAVSFADKTDSKLIPFIIKGKYKLFTKNIKIEFLKPYHIKTNDLTKENDKLMTIIKNKLEDQI